MPGDGSEISTAEEVDLSGKKARLATRLLCFQIPAAAV
jgi:hypothetical protein